MSSSSRLDRFQEARDLVTQPRALPGERTGRVEHLGGGRAGLLRALGPLGDAGRTPAGARRGLPDVARNVAGRGALLLDGGGDSGGYLGNLPDGAADLLDGGDRILGRVLHSGDLHRDLTGRLGSLGGELLDLLRDDRKSLAGL